MRLSKGAAASEPKGSEVARQPVIDSKAGVDGNASDDESDGANDLDEFIMMSSFNHLYSYFAHSLYVYKSSFHVSSFVYSLGVFLYHV